MKINDFIEKKRKFDLRSGDYMSLKDVFKLIKLIAGMFECPNRHNKNLRESETGCEICELADKIKKICLKK